VLITHFVIVTKAQKNVQQNYSVELATETIALAPALNEQRISKPDETSTRVKAKQDFSPTPKFLSWRKMAQTGQLFPLHKQKISILSKTLGIST
jgi:hypothetical protein